MDEHRMHCWNSGLLQSDMQSEEACCFSVTIKEALSPWLQPGALPTWPHCQACC